MATTLEGLFSSRAASSTTRAEMLGHLVEWMEAFKAFDADNDGLISRVELAGLIASLGCNASEQEVREIMRKADKDGDGLLSMQEFLEMNTEGMEVESSLSLSGLLRAAFEVLDLDGDGVLTGGELYNAVASLGEEGITAEECNELISFLDVDGDGVVSFEEFKQLVNALI